MAFFRPAGELPGGERENSRRDDEGVCENPSPSAQTTVFQMAEAALAVCPEISRIDLSMPNNLVGAGHCAQAIARLALECGLFVTVLDDREELVAEMPAAVTRETDRSAPEFIAQHPWQADEAIVIVSRNHELDREALASALQTSGAGYIGMIGSRRKVRHVFDLLRARGVPESALGRVHAPIGLDIGADSPAEIAVSALAEILAVLRGKSGQNLGNLSAAGGS